MRTKLPYILIALLALVLLSGTDAARNRTDAPTRSTASAARGQRFFHGTCALCHGENGQGKPGLGKDLVHQSDWMKQQTDAMLVAFVKEGRPSTTDPSFKVPMLPRGGDPTLTDADLADIVAYIRVLQQAR
ncbi:MAG TPA: cytochrome c [Symbiobacteriaceae bacterium]|jgi:disulfide bond formation protein DsbB|nr:cytochrome c [Symbiobacteriaceae bacterium]